MHASVSFNSWKLQLSSVQGKLFPVRFPASGRAIFATDVGDSLLKCMANDWNAIDRALDALRRLAFGVGNKGRIITRNIWLDRYLK